MPAPETPFVANLAMRLAWPRRRARIDRYQVIAIAFAVLLYGAVFGLIGWEAAFAPPTPPPPLEEIPVEIVQEPPPPPPPPPQPSPPPIRMAEPEYEKPATEAPRQGNNDKRDDDSAADPKKPSAAPPPPSEATPEPTPSPAAAPAPAPETPKAAEAELPEPKKAEAEKPPDPPSRPKPAPSRPMFASIPEVDFGGAAMMAPVSGGRAKATYLSTLYGMIVPRLHVPGIAHAYGRKLKGAVAFAVDSRGRLTTRWVSEPSGSSELDAAAMEAVGAASAQFPPPPRGQPMGITFTFGVE